MIIRRVALLLFALNGLVFPAIGAQSAAKQAGYPERPIRVLIPFAPGGATDIVARMLSPRLSDRLGQQIVPDNRSGAAGNIAVELAAMAQPDGYTVLIGNISTNSINPILFARTMKVNALKDLRGVTLLASIPNVILGGPRLPANTLKEAIAYVKERPGQLNYSAPLGSYSHLDMLALTAAAGIKMVHIPSKGAGETLPLLMRGETHFTESNVASNIGPIRGGQIKAYAVATGRISRITTSRAKPARLSSNLAYLWLIEPGFGGNPVPRAEVGSGAAPSHPLCTTGPVFAARRMFALHFVSVPG